MKFVKLASLAVLASCPLAVSAQPEILSETETCSVKIMGELRSVEYDPYLILWSEYSTPNETLRKLESGRNLLDRAGSTSMKWVLETTGVKLEWQQQLEERASNLANSETDCPVGVTLSELIREVSTGISEDDLAIGDQGSRSSKLSDRAFSEMLPNPMLRRRSDLCLVWNDELGYTGFETGQRDWFLECKDQRTLCERFDDAKDVILTSTGLVGGAMGATAVGSSSLGVTAVVHSSGGLILTGSGGYIAGTLGTVGATGIAIASSPVTLGALVVGGAGVGGAYLYCSGDTDEDAEISTNH